MIRQAIRKIGMVSVLILCLIPFQIYAQSEDFSFSLVFTVSDGTNDFELTVGIDDNGVTGEYVEGLDRLAPPPPPGDAFDTRLISEETAFFRKYFENNSDTKTVEFQYWDSAEGTTPITITWDNEAAAEYANFTIEDTFGGIIVKDLDLTSLGGTFVPSVYSMFIGESFLLKIEPIDQNAIPDPIVETPVFDPVGGAYTSSVNVSITSATEGTTIYYTTNGSTPDVNSNEYTGPILITETTTLKAIAIADGFTDSEVAEATYTIEASEYLAFGIPFTVSDGVNTINLLVGIDPDGKNTYVENLDILATDPPPDEAFDARIKVEGTSYFEKYLANSLVEKTFNFEYVAASGNGPITFTWDTELSETVANITITDSFGGGIFSTDLSSFDGSFTPSTASPVLGNKFVMLLTPTGNTPSPVEGITAQTPVFDPVGGVYTSSVNVSITCATEGATIYYTTNGSTPGVNSNEYTGPILITETTTLKAIAIADGFTDSEVAEATYTIEEAENYAFSLIFTVSDGTNEFELTVGVDDNGVTGEYVEGLDRLAPPPPPDGAFDARLISEQTPFFRKYFENNSNTKTVEFEYRGSSEGTTPITITWDKELSEIVANITITDSFGGAIYTTDLSSFDGSFTPSAASPLLVNSFVMLLTPTGNAPSQQEYTALLSGEQMGWRMLTAPIQEVTYDDLLDKLWTQGIEGTDVPTGMPNVYWYDELSQTWTPPTNVSNILGTSSDSGSSAGKGIIVYVFEDDNADGVSDPWPKELAVTGFPNAGDIELILTNSTEPNAEHVGWNLVANPYPFGIQWMDMVASDALSNIIPAIFIYDPMIQDGLGGYRVNYGFHIPNLPDQISHDGIIAPFQGFWARTSNPGVGGTIGFRENFQAGDNGTLYQMPESSVVAPEQTPLALTVEGAGLAESLLLMLSKEGSGDDDSGTVYDSSTNSEANSATQVSKPAPLRAQAIEFGIGSQDDLYTLVHRSLAYGESITVPLSFGAVREGEYEIKPSGLSSTDMDLQVKLIDHELQTEQILTEEQGYSFVFEPSEKALDAFEALQKEPLAQLQANPSELQVELVNRFDVVITRGVPTSIDPQEELGATLPSEFALEQNYPNPFNPSTSIEYALPRVADVRLDVFNMLGQRVAILVDSKQQPAGTYRSEFDASELSSGMYVYRLTAGGFVQTRKMIITK